MAMSDSVWSIPREKRRELRARGWRLYGSPKGPRSVRSRNVLIRPRDVDGDVPVLDLDADLPKIQKDQP